MSTGEDLANVVVKVSAELTRDAIKKIAEETSRATQTLLNLFLSLLLKKLEERGGEVKENNLSKFLSDDEPMRQIMIEKEDMENFREQALKSGLKFCPIENKKDGNFVVLFKEKDMAKAEIALIKARNEILEKNIKSEKVDLQGLEEEKQKEIIEKLDVDIQKTINRAEDLIKIDLPNQYFDTFKKESEKFELNFVDFESEKPNKRSIFYSIEEEAKGDIVLDRTKQAILNEYEKTVRTRIPKPVESLDMEDKEKIAKALDLEVEDLERGKGHITLITVDAGKELEHFARSAQKMDMRFFILEHDEEASQKVILINRKDQEKLKEIYKNMELDNIADKTAKRLEKDGISREMVEEKAKDMMRSEYQEIRKEKTRQKQEKQKVDTRPSVREKLERIRNSKAQATKMQSGRDEKTKIISERNR